MDSATENMRTAIDSYVENVFLTGELNGKKIDIDEDTQALAESVVGSLDSQLIMELNSSEKGSRAVLDYVDKIIEDLANLSEEELKEIKDIFNLESLFSSGQMTYGKYIDEVKNAVSFIDQMVEDGIITEDVAAELKLQLNSEEIIEQYDATISRLTSEDFPIQMNTEEAVMLLDSLSNYEYAVVIDLIENSNLSGVDTVEEFTSLIACKNSKGDRIQS